jgi:flagellar basal body-associated protein FliL
MWPFDILKKRREQKLKAKHKKRNKIIIISSAFSAVALGGVGATLYFTVLNKGDDSNSNNGEKQNLSNFGINVS